MAQATDEFKTSHAAQATEQYFIHVLFALGTVLQNIGLLLAVKNDQSS